MEEENEKEVAEESILSRVLGLREWFSTELRCGAFTFSRSLQHPSRWERFGTLDADSNPRRNVRLWETLCYPLVLPFSSTALKLLKPN